MAHDLPNDVYLDEINRLRDEVSGLRKLCADAAEDLPKHDPADHHGGIQAIMLWIDKLAAAGRGEA